LELVRQLIGRLRPVVATALIAYWATGVTCRTRWEVRGARECGLVPAELLTVLDRLATCLIGWHVASSSGDLHWNLLPEGIGISGQAVDAAPG
jgi:hypothetical protein